LKEREGGKEGGREGGVAEKSGPSRTIKLRGRRQT